MNAETTRPQEQDNTEDLPDLDGEWETRPFGELFKRLNVKAHQIKTSEYQTQGLHPVIDQGQSPIVSFSDQTDKLFKTPTGGVIVFGDHTRIVKFVDMDFLVGADGTQLLAMKGNNVAKFFFYQFLIKKIPDTGYNRHFKFLNDLTFKVPPLAEQRAIAEVLSDVDGLIQSLDALIAKKRVIKQAAMQQLLTGKTRLPGFSGAWETKRLGEIGPFSKGRGIKRDDVSDEGVPCIRYGELYTRYKDHVLNPVARIPLSVASKSLPIKTGDLLFAGSGETSEEIGRCAAYLGEEQVYVGGDVVVLTPLSQNSLYLGYLMNHPTVARQKARMAQGDAVVHINSRNLAQVQIDLPTLAEQRAIATILFDMDAEIAALERRRDKTSAIKQGMMQQLLTGRVRLVSNPERE